MKKEIKTKRLVFFYSINRGRLGGFIVKNIKDKTIINKIETAIK